MFNLDGDIRNVEEKITDLQNTLYDCFKVHYGTIKNVDPNTEYQEKCSNLSKRQLKKTLATLKQQDGDRYTSEMRYISKLIRSKYSKKPLNIEYSKDDEKIAKNFGGYCKEVFEKEDTVKPGFNRGISFVL